MYRIVRSSTHNSSKHIYCKTIKRCVNQLSHERPSDSFAQRRDVSFSSSIPPYVSRNPPFVFQENYQPLILFEFTVYDIYCKWFVWILTSTDKSCTCHRHVVCDFDDFAISVICNGNRYDDRFIPF